jgi:hypothetical protein
MKELSTDAYAVMIVSGILLLMMFVVMGEKNAMITEFGKAGCEVSEERNVI